MRGTMRRAGSSDLRKYFLPSQHICLEALGFRFKLNNFETPRINPENKNILNIRSCRIIVINQPGQIYAGTSTNGATHKMGPGAGAYANNEVGAAVAIGDRDIMMRFLPSLLAVEALRSVCMLSLGCSQPTSACYSIEQKEFHHQLVKHNLEIKNLKI
uniref:Asparaginase n=1 Tax=Glossina pallidipes TaxID=7398 RepID=A0A1A9ZZC2_GLOPL